MSRSVHVPHSVTRGGGAVREEVTSYERALRRAQKREKRETAAADPDFERKHPRGKAGTSEGGKFVRSGSSGAMTRAVQKRVGTKVDGQFGGLTEQAVRNFQIAHGLTVDGVVGRQTGMALLGHERKAKNVKTGELSREQAAKLRARGRRA